MKDDDSSLLSLRVSEGKGLAKESACKEALHDETKEFCSHCKDEERLNESADPTVALHHYLV